MSEWFKEAVLKTVVVNSHREFESHPYRQALVVQRIEHRFSKPRMEVRFLPRAPVERMRSSFTKWSLSGPGDPLQERREKMKEVKEGPVNRCLSGHCPPDSKKSGEQKIKDVLREAKRMEDERQAKERADRFVDDLRAMLRRIGRASGLMDIVPTMISQVALGKCPKDYLKRLLGRIRNNQWNTLSQDEKCLVVQTEASLGKQIN